MLLTVSPVKQIISDCFITAEKSEAKDYSLYSILLHMTSPLKYFTDSNFTRYTCHSVIT